MPIHQVHHSDSQTTYKWGQHGKQYKSRQLALKQMRAIFANGYKGHKKKASYMYGSIMYKTAADNTVYHRVRKGQTLSSIAKAYGVPLSSILLPKGFNPKALQIHQRVPILNPTKQYTIKNPLWYQDGTTSFYNGRPFNRFNTNFKQYPKNATKQQIASISKHNDAIDAQNRDQLHWQGVAMQQSKLKPHLIHSNGAGGLFGATQHMLGQIKRVLGINLGTVEQFAARSPQQQLYFARKYQDIIAKQRGNNLTPQQQYHWFTYGPNTKRDQHNKRVRQYSRSRRLWQPDLPVKPTYIHE